MKIRIIQYVSAIILMTIVKSCSVSPQSSSTKYKSSSKLYEKEAKPSSITPSKSNGTLQYIAKYKGIAIEEMKSSGIPASITLAQGILESGSGSSDLAMLANNHFGVKCHSEWKGKTYHKNDDKPNECFRKYAHAEESFRDHSVFLKKPRYAELYKLSITDYKGWAKGLKSCGYATNPQYAQKLIDIIERYELYQYDKKNYSQSGAKGDMYFEQTTTTTTKTETKSVEDKPVSQSTQQVKPKPVQDTPIQKQVSNSGYYTVQQGDTMYSIAKKHGLKVENIMDWNKLDSYALSVGQKIKITP
jgi:hypothetical protein